MSELIIYGRGLIAEEYCRYLEGRGRGSEVAAFAVTSMNGQGETYCGRPCMEISAAVAQYPEAEIQLALQEKYHSEVLELLKGLGVIPKEIIGLHRMTEILGEQGIEEISTACQELIVEKSPYDYSMLEVANRKHPEKRYTFYPMTQVPLSAEDLQALQETVASDTYDNVAEIKEVEEDVSLCDQDLFVAMATSISDAEVELQYLPSYIHPVVGGAANSPANKSDGYLRDDVGKNISSRNHFYSELSVAYWLYKNPPAARYLGLCHYRRHFVLTKKAISLLESGTVDVFLTRPRLTFPDVERCFVDTVFSNMDKEDYRRMLAAINEREPAMAEFAARFLKGQIHFPNNMLIARKEIYLQYGAFIFGVLQDLERSYEQEGIVKPNRYLGYIGELLTTIFFMYHRSKFIIEYLDYKLLSKNNCGANDRGNGI